MLKIFLLFLFFNLQGDYVSGTIEDMQGNTASVLVELKYEHLGANVVMTSIKRYSLNGGTTWTPVFNCYVEKRSEYSKAMKFPQYSRIASIGTRTFYLP